MQLTAAVARAQHADRIERAAERRSWSTARADDETASAVEEVVIRLARDADGEALERLRQLEGRGRGWAGAARLLVAVVDGELVAARSLDDAAAVVADPFRRTAGVVRLLDERARQAAEGPATARRSARPVAVRVR